MALRSIDLFVSSAPDRYLAATLEAIEHAPRNWRQFKVPGAAPFPGLHARYKTPIKTPPGLLTDTSKMPCPSWGLPARKSCPGAVFGPGSICEQCYAFEAGNYGLPCVKHALRERFTWTLALMRTPAGQDAFVAYMVKAIAATRKPYFRVHDSGDLFSPAYARCWGRITRQLSHVRFWLPTRSYRIANILPAIVELNVSPNVTVRPSALMLDAAPPVIEGLSAGSGVTVDDTAATCPAYKQGGECLDCRHCWDAPDAPTLYPLH